MCYTSSANCSANYCNVSCNSIVTSIHKDSFNNLVVDTNNNGSYVLDLGSSFEDSFESLKSKLKEYENKLQREKVHIGRRTDLKGHRVYGRRRKVTISKGSFRNKKGVRSVPSCVS